LAIYLPIFFLVPRSTSDSSNPRDEEFGLETDFLDILRPVLQINGDQLVQRFEIITGETTAAGAKGDAVIVHSPRTKASVRSHDRDIQSSRSHDEYQFLPYKNAAEATKSFCAIESWMPETPVSGV